ncbi:hypothetical protein Y032_0028g1683 [Ancylostoma ceylanicum]|uniref:Translation elongation factor EFTu-like domain-containing protein n=1 Tax=Ancylostoma ceylanicum TaxID=53326 RepID=A0A016UTJ3_9BILA|nr:hypothetical protein Y032_0028g1683 [Ancylostoma ceylanicum]
MQIIISPYSDPKKLVVAVDHCFPVTGKGTVMTGTVIDGSVRLNQEIEIPVLKEKKKVKGLESWKRPVEEVSAGERAAILVQQLNADSISRTMSMALLFVSLMKLFFFSEP